MKLYEDKIVEDKKLVGFVCDKCGETISYGTSRTDDFSINYGCGYGTENDGTYIKADVCDICIVEIFKKEIPTSISNVF